MALPLKTRCALVITLLFAIVILFEEFRWHAQGHNRACVLVKRLKG